MGARWGAAPFWGHSRSEDRRASTFDSVASVLGWDSQDSHPGHQRHEAGLGVGTCPSGSLATVTGATLFSLERKTVLDTGGRPEQTVSGRGSQACVYRRWRFCSGAPPGPPGFGGNRLASVSTCTVCSVGLAASAWGVGTFVLCLLVCSSGALYGAGRSN